jgi:transcriptional regulator with XRE-family HTH domain
MAIVSTLTPDPFMTEPPRSAGLRPRRAELGQFLKARRSRLSPHDVGLPPGPRRRTPGLRREEVALLAGVGVTWYTWLEQGRPINASMQVLDAVARTLRLDQPGREHLYRLAEATPVRSWPASGIVPDAVRDVLRSLDPVPASLVNTRFDVIEFSAAAEEFFWDWHSLPCVHKNTLWCCLTEPRARQQFVNYDEEVPYLVARLRAAYAAHVGEPEWEEDIRRLAGLSPEFAALWARHEVAGPQLRTRRFRHPDAGLMTFTVTELELPVCPGMLLVVETPQDAQTWARLPLTRRGRRTTPRQPAVAARGAVAASQQ